MNRHALDMIYKLLRTTSVIWSQNIRYKFVYIIELIDPILISKYAYLLWGSIRNTIKAVNPSVKEKKSGRNTFVINDINVKMNAVIYVGRFQGSSYPCFSSKFETNLTNFVLENTDFFSCFWVCKKLKGDCKLASLN